MTAFVKNWSLPLVLSVGVLVVAHRQIQAGLKACNWLDSRLGRRGCVAKVIVDSEVLDVETLGVEAIEAVPSSIYVQPMIFSPDGQMIAVPQTAMLVKADGRRASGTVIPLVNVDSQEVLHTLMVDEMALETWRPGMPNHAPNAAFSPNGEFLAASIQQNGSSVVYLWSVETGDRQWRTRMENCPEVAFSEDGEFVLCSERRIAVADGTVKGLARDVRSQPTQTTLNPNLWQPEMISPDKTLKATIEGGKYLQVSELINDTEEPLAVIRADGEFAESLYFSPDSQQLMIIGNREDAIHLWSKGSKALEKLSFSLDGVSSLVWSTDGKHIGMASKDAPNTLLIFELDRLPRL